MLFTGLPLTFNASETATFSSIGCVETRVGSGVARGDKDTLRPDSKPTLDEIKEALAGNLCRCTGYRPILPGVRTLVDDAIPMNDGCLRPIELVVPDALVDKIVAAARDDRDNPLEPIPMRVTVKE